jgi:hypothetical protein
MKAGKGGGEGGADQAAGPVLDPGTMCVRADPVKDDTNGFFVACFERHGVVHPPVARPEQEEYPELNLDGNGTGSGGAIGKKKQSKLKKGGIQKKEPKAEKKNKFSKIPSCFSSNSTNR